MARRVVVTGLGAVTPVGNDIPSTWESLVAGRSGVARITRFDPAPYAVQIAGEVKNFDPAQFIDRKELRHMDRCVQYAVVAAKQALEDAKLEITAENTERVGTIIGTAVGGIGTLLENQKVLEDRGPARCTTAHRCAQHDVDENEREGRYRKGARHEF
jgi:3-oxoacyl-[acyl-carrier-protein] synthase II